MRTTFMQKPKELEREWFVVDATGMTVGRLSAKIASILIGKHKPTYTPHVDCGDNVIIVNADKVKFTGKKLSDKMYYRHTNHPGGLKSTSAGDLLDKHPERILEKSIKGMLPKNKLGRQMYKKLYVYAGGEHPHLAQNPKSLNDELSSYLR